MDPQLKRQLRQVVAYSSTATLDYAGQSQVSAGSPATTWARVEARFREVPVGSSIVEERTSHIVILDESFPLSEWECRSSMFWIPADPYAGSADNGRRPKMVLYCTDELGRLDHVEVTL